MATASDSRWMSPSRRTVAVVMPAYNEANSIAQVVEEWHDVVTQIPGATLLILNDGSTDHTAELLEDLCAKHDRLTVINKPNSGHGSTCLMAYGWAIENGYEYVFQTDSDGQTLPSEFMSIWSNRADHAFIFGERGSRGDGVFRWVVSRFLRLCIFSLSGRWIRDANVPFRLMKCERLSPLLPEVPADFYLKNVLVTYLITQRDAIHWERITFRPRHSGLASVRFLGFVGKGVQFLKQFRQFRRAVAASNRRPSEAPDTRADTPGAGVELSSRNRLMTSRAQLPIKHMTLDFGDSDSAADQTESSPAEATDHAGGAS